MLNLDEITNENNKDHNKKWSYIPDNPYIILIIGGFGSGKTNVLLNLSEPEYQFLNKKCEDVGIKHLNDPKAFIEYSQCMGDVYNNINDYNPNKKRKLLIVFDGMIADIMSNKEFQTRIKELFIRRRQLNISLVFITQSYFSVPKEVRLNSTYYLIMKIT